MPHHFKGSRKNIYEYLFRVYMTLLLGCINYFTKTKSSRLSSNKACTLCSRELNGVQFAWKIIGNVSLSREITQTLV